MSCFKTDLKVVLVSPEANDHTGQWQLLEELIYYSDLLGKEVIIPVGFSTDFASVPRESVIAWGLFGGRAIRAAVVHDYLVRMRRVKRTKCDDVFLEAMRVDNVPEPRALIMHSAVSFYTSTGLWKKDIDLPGYEPIV